MAIIKGFVEYDGTKYSGWQKQNNSNSIQEEIENALSIVLKTKIHIVGAGRTDAGVHALNQVFHFQYDGKVDLYLLKKSINSILDYDISIKSLEFEKDNFHARYSAKSRTYLYIISLKKNVFFNKFSWVIYSKLYTNRLNEIEKIFIGKMNFGSFCKGLNEVENTFCNVIYSRWFKKHDMIFYFITADRFIHGMVRGIVGTSVEYARGKLNINDIQSILVGEKRSPLWAPPKGLILYKVEY